MNNLSYFLYIFISNFETLHLNATRGIVGDQYGQLAVLSSVLWHNILHYWFTLSRPSGPELAMHYYIIFIRIFIQDTFPSHCRWCRFYLKWVRYYYQPWKHFCQNRIQWMVLTCIHIYIRFVKWNKIVQMFSIPYMTIRVFAFIFSIFVLFFCRA